MNNQKLSKLLPRIIISITILICVGILGAFFYQRGDFNNDNNNNDSEINSNQNNDDNEGISEFVGEYSGISSILTAAFAFPNSSVTLQDSGQFDLVADGLDLSLTQIEELKQGDVYPVAALLVTGVARPTEGGDVLMSVTNFRITLSSNGEILDPQKTQELVNIVTTKLNLTIPEASEENPLEITTNYSLDATNTLVIKNTTTSAENVQLNFTGRKK
jgi:hypothetical protein